MDWPLFYHEPVMHEYHTTLGRLQFSVASAKSWNHQTWFYFHGAGGNLESWKGFAGAVMQFNTSDAYPNIVSISLGQKWFLVDRIFDQRYAGSQLFWQTLLPELKQIVGEMGHTVAIGHSMGGFNALSLYLDNPAFWDSVVLMTPAIADLSPYASQPKSCEAFLLQFAAKIPINNFSDFCQWQHMSETKRVQRGSHLFVA